MVDMVYRNLPTALQHVAVSIQGYRFCRQRLGKHFHEHLHLLESSQWWPRDLMRRFQADALNRFLQHAYAQVPYYRAALESHGYDGRKFLPLDALASLPVLEKETLRSRTESLRARNVPARSLIPSHTSGTSGAPIHVGFTIEDMQRRYAHLARMLSWHGVRLGERSVRFSGRTIFPRAERNGVFYRYNWTYRQMLMSSYHLHPANLRSYVAFMKKYEPVLIDGYPSALYIIARFMVENGMIGAIRPRLVMTTAETLEGYQREILQAAFCARVVDQYASSEGAPFITECEAGGLHLVPESGIFEFVRPGTTESAADGELAEMLVTSFTTHAYPLIRYRIGDFAVPSGGRCSCGREMPLVDQIVGRQDDVVVVRERGYVGRLDPVFKKMRSSIVESQIVQVEEDRFLLKVVPDCNFAVDDLQSVIQEMRERLGNVEVDIEYLAKIPRGPNGKFPAVVGLKQTTRSGQTNTGANITIGGEF
jgi:phenylacetate-CoA ligase